MKIEDAISAYLKDLMTLGRSPYTIRGARYSLGDFSRFLQGEDIQHLEKLTADLLEEYQQELAFRFTAKGKALAPRTQAQRLRALSKALPGF